MTVTIDKNNAQDISRILSEKLKKTRSKGNLSKHFGKLKRKLDGLAYQEVIRKNEI